MQGISKIGENHYYNSRKTNAEKTFVVKGLRLSYFINTTGILFCYYVGSYYKIPLSFVGSDILNFILTQCNNPYLFDSEDDNEDNEVN